MIYSIFIIIAIPPWKLDIIVIDNRWRSLRRVARLNLTRSNDLEAVRYWNRRCINGTFGLKVVRNQTSFFYLLILWMPWTMWSFQWWCPQGHCLDRLLLFYVVWGHPNWSFYLLLMLEHAADFCDLWLWRHLKGICAFWIPNDDLPLVDMNMMQPLLAMTSSFRYRC